MKVEKSVRFFVLLIEYICAHIIAKTITATSSHKTRFADETTVEVRNEVEKLIRKVRVGDTKATVQSRLGLGEGALFDKQSLV